MYYAKVLINLPIYQSFTYRIPDDLKNRSEIQVGIRVKVPFGKQSKDAVVIEITENETEGLSEVKDIEKVIDKEPVVNKELIELSYWMEGMYFSPAGINLFMMIPSGKRDTDIASFSSSIASTPIKELTDDQTGALKTLNSKNDGLFYLYGVTGSGKSEVFLRRAEEVIKQGRQVLYLVPEISLSHQISSDIYERFNGRVAIFHSSLTPSQRLKAWKSVMSGEVDIVVGARSSVFVPFGNLGLIILDEEHETSYKSDSSPRYIARQIAQKRALTNSAQLIMGSATPSLEAWKLIKERKINLIEMPTRIGQGAFPKIKIVSIIGEKRNISKPLETEIRKTLNDKKQVILFLNRRGFTYAYQCQACGHYIVCPNCSVTMTYHKKEDKLICHTCGETEEYITVCPECNSRDLRPKGFGTENVEEEVKYLFPKARIARLDTDTVNGDKAVLKNILEEFKEGKIDILLGTQMIAKGLNFPNAALVGILNADSTLSLPDFRSSERTFQLIQQVSGRVGRYRPDGKVIIQTSSALAPAIVYAKENNLADFYEEELRERKEVEFPPFSRLVDLTLRGIDEQKVAMEALCLEKTASKIKEDGGFDNITVYSSSPCAIAKKAKQYRYHVLLQGKSISNLLQFVKHLLAEFKLGSSKVHLEIDVDPVSLL